MLVTGARAGMKLAIRYATRVRCALCEGQRKNEGSVVCVFIQLLLVGCALDERQSIGISKTLCEENQQYFS